MKGVTKCLNNFKRSKEDVPIDNAKTCQQQQQQQQTTVFPPNMSLGSILTIFLWAGHTFQTLFPNLFCPLSTLSLQREDGNPHHSRDFLTSIGNGFCPVSSEGSENLEILEALKKCHFSFLLPTSRSLGWFVTPPLLLVPFSVGIFTARAAAATIKTRLLVTLFLAASFHVQGKHLSFY